MTFESHVLPILKTRCFACHSTGKRKHGLDVRQRRLLVRGGDTGPAIVPGNAGSSLLFQRVSKGEMPPGDREKLSAAEVETLRRWIDGGARTLAEEQPIEEPQDGFVSPEDREHWAFRPVREPPVPDPRGRDRLRGPVDAFILEKLEAKGLSFSPDAEPRALLRRACFDLLGLPPAPEDAERFIQDASPDAHERLLDRLLASPRHGERWGRHWLDAAGYADSDGYTEADTERAEAWRYRDYVIRSLNADKPFARFLEEQLAGDEMAGYPGRELTPENVELLTATGFTRCAADGTGQPNVDQRAARNQVIADTVGILGSGVLGLTLGCAQCHDHRYDPISQRDYHRLRAAFEPGYDVESWKPPGSRRISLYTPADRARAAEVAALVEAKRTDRNAREAEAVHAVVAKLLAEKVPGEERDAARAAFETPADKRAPEQKALIEKHPFLKISGGTLYQYDQAAADRIKAMDTEIAQVAAGRPPEEFVRALWEEPGRVPSSRLLIRGQPDQPAEEVAPGILAVLAPPDAGLELPAAPGGSLPTSGRRLRLARWLASPQHPLTGRVLVNRLWMHHFGRGIVATPGDFGRQGDPPSHPELLDWLARELVRGDLRLKRIHRLIMTSTAYRQAAARVVPGDEVDPEAALLWRKPLIRLEAEAIRDAMLAASGALSTKAGGPPVPVKEDADGSIVVGIDRKVDANNPGPEVPIGEEAFRRTIYVQSRRTRPLSFTSTFDAPPLETNCTRRTASTTATQALLILNGPFVREQAQLFAKRLEREAPNAPARVELAFRIAFARAPVDEERREALSFLEAGAAATALPDFCQVLLGSNEFILID